uniref:Sushi domain-containing protein n=1 Tax=Amphimedon queenslandica TaxID=400682 RepID=A0A1X7VHY5_AMPQE
MNLGYLLMLFLLLLFQSCLSVPISRFYDFAGSTGDQTFTNVDDQSTSLNLQSNFVFYGTNFSTVFINNNGLLSFYAAHNEYTSAPFPLPQTLIAPFWADVDTRNGAGTVYYRETTASAIVSKVAQDIALAFPNQPPFTAKSVVIVTWSEVGYYEENDDKHNTFQCVLATDGGRSYVIFLYLDDGINWVTGDASGGLNGLGGTEAYVGFNFGGQNATYFAVQGSRTPAVIDIETTSNVEVAGLWIFQVNEAEIITSTIGSCGTPDQLYANATILSYNTTTVNSTATYSCENGYNLVGVSVRTCQSSGNWSGSPPYCQIG